MAWKDLFGKTPEPKGFKKPVEIKKKPTKVKSERKSRNYKPLVFEEYIGQERTKTVLKRFIESTKKRGDIFPHLLIYGKPGTGKTTLANIVANELSVRMEETIASQLKTGKDILELISKVKGGILFIDEIHGLERDAAEEGLYKTMEDFKTSTGKKIKPFTVVGATTELGEVIAKVKPLFRRFDLKRELDPYTVENLVQIGKQYKNKIFPKDELNDETLAIIAENSRGTPSAVISLIKYTIYFEGKIDEVLKTNKIIYKGFTTKDLKVLQYIATNLGGVGLQGIAAYLDTGQQNYLYEIEPYLLQHGALTRTSRGRKITVEGIKLIDILKEKQNESF